MASKQVWFVSRQIYWGVDEEDSRCVEIAYGGSDYANSDMLVKQYEGEGVEYNDPRAALNAATAIRDAWIADCNKDTVIRIDHGFTGGSTMPFLDTRTDEELFQWAENEYAELPKCDECGEVRSKDDYYRFYDDEPDGKYCDEACANKALEDWQRNQVPCPVCEGEKYIEDSFCQGTHCDDHSMIDSDPAHQERGHVVVSKENRDGSSYLICKHCVALATAKQGVN